MADYQTLKIKNQFEVLVVDAPEPMELSDGQKQQIELIWQEELKKRELFNGEILSCLSFDKERLTGEFLPYKLFIAKLRNPEMQIKIIPVSVSGLILHGDNIMIGRRSSLVSEFPGYYELPPSGGIGKEMLKEGRVELRSQIAKELFEEIGITPRKIRKIQFFMLAYDQKQDHIDLCAEIKITPFAMQSISGEYTQIMTIPKNEISQFVEKYLEQFVPLSILILKLKKLI